MKKYLWAALSTLIVVSAASAASAQTYTYIFTGSFNNLSGNVMGQFTYDQTANTFSAVSVSTTAGNGPAGAAPAVTYTVVKTGAAASGVTFLAGPAGIGQKAILFNISPDLTTANPAISAAAEATCTDAACGGFTFNRQGYVPGTFGRTLVVVPPAPVPTMSEWAMILFGMILAGGAALYIQRRRTFG